MPSAASKTIAARSRTRTDSDRLLRSLSSRLRSLSPSIIFSATLIPEIVAPEIYYTICKAEYTRVAGHACGNGHRRSLVNRMQTPSFWQDEAETRHALDQGDGSGVRVAVIDSRIDFSHPLFAGVKMGDDRIVTKESGLLRIRETFKVTASATARRWQGSFTQWHRQPRSGVSGCSVLILELGQRPCDWRHLKPSSEATMSSSSAWDVGGSAKCSNTRTGWIVRIYAASTSSRLATIRTIGASSGRGILPA